MRSRGPVRVLVVVKAWARNRAGDRLGLLVVAVLGLWLWGLLVRD